MAVEPLPPAPEQVAQEPTADAVTTEEVYKKTTGIGREATKGGVVAKRIEYSGQIFAKD